jgi:hypothetical protein
MEPRNRCQGINSASLCSMAGRYDNPIPTRCLAPIDFLKIPAQSTFSIGNSLCIDCMYSETCVIKPPTYRCELWSVKGLKQKREKMCCLAKEPTKKFRCIRSSRNTTRLSCHCKYRSQMVSDQSLLPGACGQHRQNFFLLHEKNLISVHNLTYGTQEETSSSNIIHLVHELHFYYFEYK